MLELSNKLNEQHNAQLFSPYICAVCSYSLGQPFAVVTLASPFLQIVKYVFTNTSCHPTINSDQRNAKTFLTVSLLIADHQGIACIHCL